MTEEQKAAQEKTIRRAALNYQVRRQISASGRSESMPGIALGGLAGAALGARGRVGVLGGAAIGGALGFVGARAAGRMDEKARLQKLVQDLKAGQAATAQGRRIGTTNLETNLKPALRELAARSERIVELAKGPIANPAGYKSILVGMKNGEFRLGRRKMTAEELERSQRWSQEMAKRLAERRNAGLPPATYTKDGKMIL